MGPILQHFRIRVKEGGFTLIELMVTMTILAIIAAAVAGVIATFVLLFLNLPREIKAKMIANDIAETVIKGVRDKPGIWHSISITDSTGTTCSYTAGYPTSADQVTMTFTYDTMNLKVTRTVGAAPAETIPYYTSGDSSVTCPSSVFFKYYDAAGSQIANPNTQALRNTIRRIEMTYTVTTGTGATQGSYTTTAGTDIKQYL
jgi:prepilin-type N-terminal cleavage/methylation domain-containing protein